MAEYRMCIYDGQQRSGPYGTYMISVKGVSGVDTEIDIYDNATDLNAIGKGIVSADGKSLILSGDFSIAGGAEFLPASGFVSINPTKIYEVSANEQVDVNGYVTHLIGYVIEECTVGQVSQVGDPIGIEYTIDWGSSD